MMLGKISDKVTTTEFSFEADAKVKNLEYLAVKTSEGHWVTAYIDSITRYADRTTAHAKVIGYRNQRGFLVVPGSPFAPDTPVYSAGEDLIRSTLGLPDNGLYIGLLMGHRIKVNLPVKIVTTKHVSIMAKTGTGKSYLAGVLLEELAENNVPVVVIDPHGEYASLARENDEQKELKFAHKFDIKPKSYASQVEVFSQENGSLRLNPRLTAEEIFQVLPTKVSGAQRGLIFSALKNIGGRDYTLSDVISEVSALPSQSKWSLLSGLEFLANSRLFSENPTKPGDLVKEGRVSILDIKFAKPEIQQMIVFKVVEELFSARKKGEIPGFVLVLEEAHNFCPERGYGEVASSKIVRTIASEGRKFGISLCAISQRPARVDKNVLSQCNTQIILKVTNPNDLKAVCDSTEDISSGVRDEIKDLPIGSALIIGAAEQPILTEIRTRRSKHGGESIELPDGQGSDGVKNLAFPARFSRKDVEKDYDGAESLTEVNYPIWMVKGTADGENVHLYIDGLMGEVIFESDGELQRTKGMRSLVTLSSTERMIILYLAKTDQAAIDRVAVATRLVSSDVRRLLRNLMEKGLVSYDGNNYRAAKINIPKNLLRCEFSVKPEESVLHGMVVNTEVDKKVAEKIAGLFGIRTEEMKTVYCPYWLVVYKNRKALVNGLTKKLDAEATREIIGLIR